MKRPGRPRLDQSDTSVQVWVSVPAKKFDELCREALEHGTSVPEIVRRKMYGHPSQEKKIKK